MDSGTGMEFEGGVGGGEDFVGGWEGGLDGGMGGGEIG